MAVKGTDIVKKLPSQGKKNCKECGFPTCFAFAMKLASGGATLEKCPYLEPEVVLELEDALAPAMKLVTIGTGPKAFQVGNEEVVFRHEKTYVHPTGVALLVSDNEPDAKIDEKVKKISSMSFDVVGINLKADLLALKCDSGNKDKYLGLVNKVCKSTDVPVMLLCEDTDLLFAARDACADKKPLIYPITEQNIDQAIPKIKDKPTPLGVRANSLEELIPLTAKLKDAKIDEVVIDPGSKSMADALKDQTFIRRAAIKQGFRPLGYPTMVFPSALAKDGLKEILAASVFIIKFAGIVVLSDFDEASLRPLLTQRLNIYTDPRMPLSVEEKLYAVGEANENSPVLITTNWALTYFIVSAEIESSKVPSWLLVKDSEGLGVLTAWAAGKFNGDSIAPFVKKSGVEDKTKVRQIVIPGKVARIKGELQEALPGWEVIVGPRESSEIPGFLPGYAAKLKN